MTSSFVIRNTYIKWIPRLTARVSPERWVILLASLAAILATTYSLQHGYIIAYGDAESHLNIAKRVVDSLTPGFAQLGGIWLPLPHLLLMPFVYFDFFWRTGLAGSIVSGAAFIISSVYIYKLANAVTKSAGAAFLAAVIFIANPNILYLQSTSMTELPLIMFSILSSYFFIRFLLDDTKLLMLIAAAAFGFCASLSRYDGWALVLMEAGVLFLFYLPFPLDLGALRERWRQLEGRLILFATLAFFGIILWLLWDFLILGDPLYFTHSQFSANSQQMGWLAKGQLPAYNRPLVALLYYSTTSMEISGTLIAGIALAGMLLFASDKKQRYRGFILLILLVPFIFNVLTLVLGQSIIFLPGITPATFEWTLFNARYGVMMVSVISLFAGYLFSRSRVFGRTLIVGLLFLQCALFFIGFTPVLAWQDGVSGLSSLTGKLPDAQYWLVKNYDYGLVLMDDYKRTLSIIKSPIPMQNVIYIGNKPYWEESLAAPEKYARWIIIQRDDELWNRIYGVPALNGRLYKYFSKAYTSDEILIFQRNAVPEAK